MKLSWLSLAALAAPSVGLADPPEPAPSAPPTVSDVVVTATIVPSRLSDQPDVRVIDRAEIDARQATFAADILATIPGVTVVENGAFGGVSSVRIRGATPDKTLVLIDGLPQNDASQPNGAYDFSSLELGDIQRVEVLSGPQSSLWGSDAIGGVIAFTTREIDGWQANAEGGSLGQVDGSVEVGRATTRWALGGGASGFRTDGISKADGLGAQDPFWNWTANAYGRLTLSPSVSLDVHARYVDWKTEIDGFNAVTFAFGDTPGQTYAGHGWTGTARAIIDDPWGFRHTVTGGLFDLARTSVYPQHPEDSSSYWSGRQDYRYLATRGGADDALGLAFGAERNASHASISTGQGFNLGVTSGFALARWRPAPPLTLTGSVRYDAPDAFRGQATGRASAALRLPAGFAVEAAWGQGFKVPTVSEIACDFCFPAGASTNLKPEHADGWDMALVWTSSDKRFYARVTGFELDVRDQIAFSPTFPFRYFNLAHTRSRGVELDADARLAASLTLEAGYAYVDARDLVAGGQLLRTPRNSGSLALFWAQGPWRATFALRGEGDDADVDPAAFIPARRPGFTVATLSGAYEIRPGLELTAKLDNVTDAHFQEVLGYGEPRLRVLVGLRAKS